MGCGPASGRGAQWNPPNPVVSFEKRETRSEVRQKDGRAAD